MVCPTVATAPIATIAISAATSAYSSRSCPSSDRDFPRLASRSSSATARGDGIGRLLDKDNWNDAEPEAPFRLRDESNELRSGGQFAGDVGEDGRDGTTRRLDRGDRDERDQRDEQR